MKKFAFIFLCTILIAFFCISTASAEISRKGAISISAGIGEYHFECDECFESPSLTGGLAVGYNLSEKLAAELLVHFIDTEYCDMSADSYLYRLNLLYNVPLGDGKVVPFITAGLGGISSDLPHKSFDTDYLFNYGVGLRYFLTEKLALRGDVAHIIKEPFNNNLLYTIGLSYFIGGAGKEPPKPLDSDRDGVINIYDKCPSTPAGVAVDAVGCPLDSDLDGVYDYLDKCPGTPAGVKVALNGCPPDRDGDGFADYLDKCPDVPGSGSDNGCPVQVIRMRIDVEFDTGRAEVKTEYHEEIGKLAETMKEYPDSTLVLEGHTDSTGSDSSNLDLSQRRVDSVRQYMIDTFGINPARITATGYGETRPIADNATEEGRSANRRVEAKIEYEAEVKQ